MKIVKFVGGLGNQMFQYAFYLTLAKKFKHVKADLGEYNLHEIHNGFELENIFPIKLNRATNFELNLLLPTNRKWTWRKLRRIAGTRTAYWEDSPEFQFHEHLLKNKQSQYYNGYWQNVAYINLVEDQIRASFLFPIMEDEKNSTIKSIIQNHPNTVSVHVRRGDYNDHVTLGGICTNEYYQKSITYMKNKLEEPLFIFFSNDITWCKQNFRDLNAQFIDWNIGKDSFRDMQLMSFCTHNIIANSSFSWWAAWLNQNPSKITVSPNKWINVPNLDTSGMILPSFITF